MEKLVLILDCFIYKDFDSYLLSLNGVSNIIINNEDNFKIAIEYNPDYISIKILILKILTFLEVLNKTASILAFDKCWKKRNFQI